MDTSNNIKIASNVVNSSSPQIQKQYVSLNAPKDTVSFGSGALTEEKKPKTVLVGILSAAAGAGVCFIFAKRKIGKLNEDICSLVKKNVKLFAEKSDLEIAKNMEVHSTKAENRKLNREIAELEIAKDETISNHVRENETLKVEKANLQEQIDTHIREKETLKADNEASKIDLNNVKGTLSRLQKDLDGYKSFRQVQEVFKKEHGVDLNHKELEVLHDVLSREGGEGISILLDESKPLKAKVNMLTYTANDGTTQIYDPDVSFSLYQKAFKMINDNHAAQDKGDIPWTKAIVQAVDGMDRMVNSNNPNITDNMRQETEIMAKSLVPKLKENGFEVSRSWTEKYL